MGIAGAVIALIGFVAGYFVGFREGRDHAMLTASKDNYERGLEDGLAACGGKRWQ